MAAIADLSLECPICGAKLRAPMKAVTEHVHVEPGKVGVKLIVDLTGLKKHMAGHATNPNAALSIPWPPDEATVEKVARAGYESVNYAEPTRDRWRTVARAALDALAGDRS